jgi:hypothetical protein
MVTLITCCVELHRDEANEFNESQIKIPSIYVLLHCRLITSKLQSTCYYTLQRFITNKASPNFQHMWRGFGRDAVFKIHST